MCAGKHLKHVHSLFTDVILPDLIHGRAGGGSGPDANAVRLVLLAELVSAAGFTRDRLYIEWQLHFNPDLWVLQHSEQEVPQPGMIQVGGQRGVSGSSA